MITRFFKISLRNFVRYYKQNIICILGLIIGFTAFIMGGYWWYWENNFDNFHPQASNTYAITTMGITKNVDGTHAEINQLHKDDAVYFIQHIPDIVKFAHVGLTWSDYQQEDSNNPTETIAGLVVDTNFFSIFSADFIDGGYNSAPFDKSHIILTEYAARKYMGKVACVGETFHINERYSYIIAGVMKNYPTNTNFNFDYIVLGQDVFNHVNRSAFFVQLKESCDIGRVKKTIEEHASVAKAKYNFEKIDTWSFKLRTLSDVHIECNQQLSGRFRNIQLLAITGVLALVCALMNFLVLYIGQQQKNRKNNLTLQSMGATKGNLYIKSAMDFVLPLILSLVLAFILIGILFPYYQSFTEFRGYGVYEDYVNRLDIWNLYLYSFKWIVLIICGFLLLSSAVILGLISGKNKQSPTILRRVLIITQVFIGAFFFIISLVLFKQFHYMQNSDKGLEIDNILEVNVGMNNTIDFSTFRDLITANPSITDVTYTSSPILSPTGTSYGTIEENIVPKGLDKDLFKSDWNVWLVEENFFRFFGIKLKSGNWFIRNENSVIINETGAKTLENIDPLDYTYDIFGVRDNRITGIIQDFHYCPMQYPLDNVVYRIRNYESEIEKSDPYRYIYIKYEPGTGDQVAPLVLRTIEQAQNGQVVKKENLTKLTKTMEEFRRPDKVLIQLFTMLAFISILIVSFGIYSLVSLTIEQRQKEIAIRKVNGAGYIDILRFFLKEYLILVLTGNILALVAGAYFSNYWLETYAYRTSASWWLYGIVFICTCIIVLFSIFFKAKAAAKANPAEVLKSE